MCKKATFTQLPGSLRAIRRRLLWWKLSGKKKGSAAVSENSLLEADATIKSSIQSINHLKSAACAIGAAPRDFGVNAFTDPAAFFESRDGHRSHGSISPLRKPIPIDAKAP